MHATQKHFEQEHGALKYTSVRRWVLAEKASRAKAGEAAAPAAAAAAGQKRARDGDAGADGAGDDEPAKRAATEAAVAGRPRFVSGVARKMQILHQIHYVT